MDQDGTEQQETAGEQTAGGETEPQQPEVVPVAGAVADDLRNKLLRLQADFDNYRRRTQRVRAEAVDDTKREVLGALLGVYDNLLRALEQAEANQELMPFLSGFEMIQRQCADFLAAQGLEEIPATDDTEFDPAVHEATGMMPLEEGQAPNTIARELQKGFTYKGMCVRPSRVLVRATPE